MCVISAVTQVCFCYYHGVSGDLRATSNTITVKNPAAPAQVTVYSTSQIVRFLYYVGGVMKRNIASKKCHTTSSMAYIGNAPPVSIATLFFLF